MLQKALGVKTAHQGRHTPLIQLFHADRKLADTFGVRNTDFPNMPKIDKVGFNRDGKGILKNAETFVNYVFNSLGYAGNAVINTSYVNKDDSSSSCSTFSTTENCDVRVNLDPRAFSGWRDLLTKNETRFAPRGRGRGGAKKSYKKRKSSRRKRRTSKK